MFLLDQFSNLIWFFLLAILFLVLFIIFLLIFNSFFSKNLYFFHILEMVWTITPCFVLILISLPSIKILYITENNFNNFLTLKIIGHQWYWSYELTDFLNKRIDRFIDSTGKNTFRLLDTDNYLSLPFNIPIRCIITSTDVIHSWTIPNLMLKLDANPRQLRQIYISSIYPNISYGQCSEICGINHSFIPIKLEFTTSLLFKNFLIKFRKSFKNI
jgi:cytochrome c oxidase subunit 2